MVFKMKGSPHKLGTIQGATPLKDGFVPVKPIKVGKIPNPGATPSSDPTENKLAKVGGEDKRDPDRKTEEKTPLDPSVPATKASKWSEKQQARIQNLNLYDF